MHHLGQDAYTGDTVLHVVGHHVVVDAPTEVLGTSTGAEAPPAVLVGFFHQMTEAIDVTVAEKIGHPLSLFGEEARHRVVLSRVVDVDVLVTDVVVAGDDEVGALLS